MPKTRSGRRSTDPTDIQDDPRVKLARSYTDIFTKTLQEISVEQEALGAELQALDGSFRFATRHVLPLNRCRGHRQTHAENGGSRNPT